MLYLCYVYYVSLQSDTEKKNVVALAYDCIDFEITFLNIARYFSLTTDCTCAEACQGHGYTSLHVVQATLSGGHISFWHDSTWQAARCNLLFAQSTAVVGITCWVGMATNLASQFLWCIAIWVNACWSLKLPHRMNYQYHVNSSTFTTFHSSLKSYNRNYQVIFAASTNICTPWH